MKEAIGQSSVSAVARYAIWTHLGNSLSIKTEDNAAHVFIAMLHVKVDLASDLGSLASCLGSLGEVDEGEGQDDQHREENALNARHCVDRYLLSSSRGAKSVLESRTNTWRDNAATECGVMAKARALASDLPWTGMRPQEVWRK